MNDKELAELASCFTQELTTFEESLRALQDALQDFHTLSQKVSVDNVQSDLETFLKAVLKFQPTLANMAIYLFVLSKPCHNTHSNLC